MSPEDYYDLEVEESPEEVVENPMIVEPIVEDETVEDETVETDNAHTVTIISRRTEGLR